jgi:hypothetical protein
MLAVMASLRIGVVEMIAGGEAGTSFLGMAD